MINQIIFRHYNHVGRATNRTTTKEALKDPKTAVILGVCSLIVLENLIVLLAVWKNHKFHNRMYFFIANLALCDLLAAVAYMVNLMMSGDMTFHLSTTAWFVREGSMFVALSACIFSLLAIAIERHLTMIKMRPYDANKKYRVFLLIGTCWLIAVTLGALPILGWNCLDKFAECSTTLPLYSKNYVAFCITIFISLLLAISVLYARIYILVKTTSSKVTKHSNSEHSMALLRTVSIVVGVFIAYWTPLFVLFLIDVACQGGAKSCPILLQADWFLTLAVLNSAMNPVIYTLASREMRRAFYRLLCGCVVKEEEVGSKQNTDPNKSKTSSNSQREAEQDGPENVNAQNQPADSKQEPMLKTLSVCSIKCTPQHYGCVL